MEKNEFLLCSEVIYRINVCRTVVELRKVLLAQLKLIIPYACASIIPIQEDPDSHEIRHGTPSAGRKHSRRWSSAGSRASTRPTPPGSAMPGSRCFSGTARSWGRRSGSPSPPIGFMSATAIGFTTASR